MTAVQTVAPSRRQSFGLVWGPEPNSFITALSSDVSGKLLLAATRAGTVLRSTDGGKRFESVKLGFIARSGTSTETPVTQSQALLRHMNGVAFESKAGALVAVGTDEGAIRSVDGGKTWQNVPLPVADGTTMFSIAASAKTGTLVASGTGSALLRSTDSGSHFVATRGATGSLSTVYALSDGVYSVDQGQRFVRSESDSEADLRAIAVTPKAVVVVGTAGAVLRSTDGGRHFSAVTVDSNANLMSVAFHPKRAAVVAVGNDGTILSSFDDGASWVKANSGVTERLRLAFYEPATSQIVVVGHAGALLLSKDGRQFTRFTNHTRSKLGAYTYHAPSGQFVLVGERIVGLRLLAKT